ncbi:MAG: dTDP-glucose 4,6-dehydratase [Myxococcales bacterium]
MRLLVTGGCGFIGSAFVRLVLRERPGWRVVNFDKLTYAASPESLTEIEGNPDYGFVRGDVVDRAALDELLQLERIEAVVHLAAESHVDRSILGPQVFVQTNVLGTSVVLEAALAAGVRRVVVASTDEVYGSAEPGIFFDEEAPLRPSSPYSASKASADLIAQAFGRTYGLDVVIARSTNNYGPWQHPEKLIPLAIARAQHGEPIPVYGDGRQRRDWLHVEDNARALLAMLEAGRAGAVYNLAAGAERENLEIVRAILRLMGRDDSLLRFVADRPGHDRRYGIDARRARSELGWRPQRELESALEETVRWYEQNRAWWEALLSASPPDRFASEWERRQLGSKACR